jgi:hypothetical protein
MDYILGGASSAEVNLENASQVQFINNFTITNGATHFIAGVAGGNIGFGADITVTIQNGPSFTGSFISLTQNESMNVPPTVTWVGPIDAGRQYSVAMNSSLETYGNFGKIPGNGATVASGGQVE